MNSQLLGDRARAELLNSLWLKCTAVSLEGCRGCVSAPELMFFNVT